VRIALFGSGGFIGSNLVEHLLEATGHQVVGLDADDEKTRDIDTRGRFECHVGDIRQAAPLVEELVETSDVVIDLIAHANPSMYVSQPLEVVDLNLFQNLTLVDLCVKHSKRIIQFSTCEVYGPSEGRREPYSEDGANLVRGPIRNQRWIYASAKELLERIIYAHGQQGDLDFTIVRPFNFVGPKIDYLVEAGSIGGPRVFSHFMSALVGKGPLRLVDGGAAHRSYTHIADATRAVQLVLENPDECRSEIMNIGNPNNGTTIRELASLMLELYEELTGSPAESSIVEISGDQFYGAGYEDCDWRIPDVRKMERLGWRPQLDLRETFKRTMQWHLDRLNGATELPSYLRRNDAPQVSRRSR